MATVAPINEHIVKVIKEDFPKFQVRPKKGHWYMEMLGWLMFWMWRFPKDEETGKRKLDRTFMTRFSTTLGHSVFVFDMEVMGKSYYWRTLAHEYVHLCDSRKYTAIPYSIAYLAPQCFALLAFGAFWNQWFLLFLICGLPWPSPGRAYLEFRGYTMTMACRYWQDGKVKDSTKDFIAENFYGSDYYWMLPFKKYVYRVLDKQIAKIVSGEILQDKPFQIIHDSYRAYEASK